MGAGRSLLVLLPHGKPLPCTFLASGSAVDRLAIRSHEPEPITVLNRSGLIDSD